MLPNEAVGSEIQLCDHHLLGELATRVERLELLYEALTLGKRVQDVEKQLNVLLALCEQPVTFEETP